MFQFRRGRIANLSVWPDEPQKFLLKELNAKLGENDSVLFDSLVSLAKIVPSERVDHRLVHVLLLQTWAVGLVLRSTVCTFKLLLGERVGLLVRIDRFASTTLPPAALATLEQNLLVSIMLTANETLILRPADGTVIEVMLPLERGRIFGCSASDAFDAFGALPVFALWVDRGRAVWQTGQAFCVEALATFGALDAPFAALLHFFVAQFTNTTTLTAPSALHHRLCQFCNARAVNVKALGAFGAKDHSRFIVIGVANGRTNRANVAFTRETVFGIVLKNQNESLNCSF